MTQNPPPSTEPVPPVGGTPAEQPTAEAPAQGAPAPQEAPPAPTSPPTAPPAPVPPRVQAPGPAPEPTTSVGWVIAGVILFWPTAIPALLASQRAARALGTGDRATAATEAARAKRWGIVSVCAAAGLFVLSAAASFLWFLLLVFAVHGEHGYTVHEDGFDLRYEYDSDVPFGFPGTEERWEDFYGPDVDGPSFGAPGERSEDGRSFTIPVPEAPTPEEAPTPRDAPTPKETPAPKETPTPEERSTPSPSES